MHSQLLRLQFPLLANAPRFDCVILAETTPTEVDLLVNMAYSSSSSEYYSQRTAFSSATLLYTLGRDKVWFGGGTPGSSQASQSASQASQARQGTWSGQDSTRRRRHSSSPALRKRARPSESSTSSQHSEASSNSRSPSPSFHHHSFSPHHSSRSSSPHHQSTAPPTTRMVSPRRMSPGDPRLLPSHSPAHTSQSPSPAERSGEEDEEDTSLEQEHRVRPKAKFCPFCKEPITGDHLSRHIRNHHDEAEAVTCSGCGKSFDRQEYLNTHLRKKRCEADRDINIYSVRCSRGCDKSFKTISTMEKHCTVAALDFVSVWSMFVCP